MVLLLPGCSRPASQRLKFSVATGRACCYSVPIQSPEPVIAIDSLRDTALAVNLCINLLLLGPLNVQASTAESIVFLSSVNFNSTNVLTAFVIPP